MTSSSAAPLPAHDRTGEVDGGSAAGGVDLAAARAAAVEAARLGVRMARTARSREVVETKGPNDFATEVDRAVEAAVTEVLRRGADVPVQGEELSPTEDAPTRWIVDPVDGTFNYAAGIPVCAVNVALLVDGELAVAVTAGLSAGVESGGGDAAGGDGDLPTDDVLVAVVGQGLARVLPRSEEVRTVSRVGARASAVTVGDVGWTTTGPWPAAVRAATIAAVAPAAGRVRIVGSSALELAWVAAGRTAGAVLFGNKPWDTFPGVLLVREGGGVVLDAHGEPWRPGADSVLAAADEETAAALVDAVRTGVRTAERRALG
ncbi:inositol monophosphatase family protein [Cellulomonas marina]|uniref:Myo-inositol-1(Or 4)-monophosphatase n=1 Tax=Cellulomonas marina TaxID=988821 RepID=A0A1I0V4C4_9CELL|nr:inositol monophosphatase [Cellulomonas marina]SFA71175.1 myo-inositol-1(or 4)-monophosphatase [Cellulomonas marina]